jgi:hypothetical protein
MVEAITSGDKSDKQFGLLALTVLGKHVKIPETGISLSPL